jgi:hypothetical protein
LARKPGVFFRNTILPPFANIAKQTDIATTKIASPFGEIIYLLSQIEMPDIKPGFVRDTQQLGSSLREWID